MAYIAGHDGEGFKVTSTTRQPASIDRCPRLVSFPARLVLRPVSCVSMPFRTQLEKGWGRSDALVGCGVGGCGLVGGWAGGVEWVAGSGLVLVFFPVRCMQPAAAAARLYLSVFLSVFFLSVSLLSVSLFVYLFACSSLAPSRGPFFFHCGVERVARRFF